MVHGMDEVMKFTMEKHVLDFNFPAGTSRGVLAQKKLWLVYLTANGHQGVGECSIIEGLTPEYQHDEQYEAKLKVYLNTLNQLKLNPEEILDALDSFFPDLNQHPSMRFGIECALISWCSMQTGIWFDNNFTRGRNSIPINGLIWMGDIAWMKSQVEKKITEGYTVLKFKIGALDWKLEHTLIKELRKQFSSDELVIRVDANGALNHQNVFSVLTALSDLSVHSIEQPVAAEARELLSAVCEANILPIALDESLIPCYSDVDKSSLIEHVKPQYIVLKPSLHGGVAGVRRWISLAESQGIGWWITSALESNIGLCAIAQLAGNYPLNMAQGLGTGGLFTTNFPSNLKLNKGYLAHHLPEHG